jgi:hypothetical protein
LQRADGTRVVDVGTQGLGVVTGDFAAGEEAEVSFRNRWSLGVGTYFVTVHVTDLSRRLRCDWKEAAATLVVTSPHVTLSIADLGTTVSLRRLADVHQPPLGASVSAGEHPGGGVGAVP